MTGGLEKIISQIEIEGNAAAGEKIEAAKKQAEQILTSAREECEKIEAEEAARRRNAKASLESRIDSSMDMERRTAILAAKQEMITDILERAYHYIVFENTDAYFALLEKLLAGYVQPQEGEIYLCREDRERMPAGFVQRIAMTAQQKGGSLKLMDADRKIDHGFILVYPGTGEGTSIEENCTVRAVMEMQKEELQDIVHKILFAS